MNNRLERIIDKFITEYVFNNTTPVPKEVFRIDGGVNNCYYVPTYKLWVLSSMFDYDPVGLVNEWLKLHLLEEQAVIVTWEL